MAQRDHLKGFAAAPTQLMPEAERPTRFTGGLKITEEGRTDTARGGQQAEGKGLGGETCLIKTPRENPLRDRQT